MGGGETGQESTETEAVGAVLGLCKVLREKVKTASGLFGAEQWFL